MPTEKRKLSCFFLPKLEASRRLQVVGFESQGEALTDFAINPGASHQRPAGADFRELLSQRAGLAPGALMAIHQLANRRPPVPLAAGKLHSKKKVVLSSR